MYYISVLYLRIECRPGSSLRQQKDEIIVGVLHLVSVGFLPPGKLDYIASKSRLPYQQTSKNVLRSLYVIFWFNKMFFKVLARLEDLERVVSEQKTQLQYQGDENLKLTRKLRNQVAESVNNKKEDPSESAVTTEQTRNAKVAAIFPRSCQEIVNTNPTPDTQFQLIDPDGPGVGDPPIMVQCIGGKFIEFWNYLRTVSNVNRHCVY